MSKQVTVSAREGGQAAGRDINDNTRIAIHLTNNGSINQFVGLTPPGNDGNAHPDELRSHLEHARAVGGVLWRRFMMHRAVFVHLACTLAFALAMLWSWEAPPMSAQGAVALLIGSCAVLPSAWWMVHERAALYAALNSARAKQRALERDLVLAEADAEVRTRGGS